MSPNSYATLTTKQTYAKKKLRSAENKSTELVPLNYKPTNLVSDKTRLTANYRANIVVIPNFFCNIYFY